MSYPVLYSFRRCPYAMRARMAIAVSAVVVELREVDLRSKPVEMLAASPKATVPVLVLEDKTVIDESLGIMHWALNQNDPEHWLDSFSDEQQNRMADLIEENDTHFKQQLDHYKYADRFPAQSQEYYRSQGEDFLKKLNKRLQHTACLFGDRLSLADIAIFPFIRQFAHVDKKWFESTEYSHLQQWLAVLLESETFSVAMQKFDIWRPNGQVVLFKSG